MNKSELVTAVALEADITKKAATLAVNTTLAVIGDTLAMGAEVRLDGFGTFSKKVRPARMGRNPATGASLQIAEKTTAVFKAGKGLNDQL
jgi:DNA-binding protein HU-beta